MNKQIKQKYHYFIPEPQRGSPQKLLIDLLPVSVTPYPVLIDHMYVSLHLSGLRKPAQEKYMEASRTLQVRIRPEHPW